MNKIVYKTPLNLLQKKNISFRIADKYSIYTNLRYHSQARISKTLYKLRDNIEFEKLVHNIIQILCNEHFAASSKVKAAI